MDEQEILRQINRWNPEAEHFNPGITRTNYINSLYPSLTRKEVLVLQGIRRCGKSTIMKQLIVKLLEEGVKPYQILFINLDDFAFRNHLEIETLDKILITHKKHNNPNKKTYYFIDEIQNIHEWERYIRTIYDREEPVKFIISGSNAHLLSQELATKLTGRNLTHTIFPLSFEEFKTFGKKRKFNEYLLYGGFPEVVLEKNEEQKKLILQQYLQDIIYRDVITRHKIKNVKLIIDLATSIIASTGTKVSKNKLSKIFKLSDDTIALYINYFLDAFLLYEVTFFSYSTRTKHDVSKLPKFYVVDNGLFAIATQHFSENRGRIVENSVLLSLRINNEYISYWSEGNSEVDFIVNNNAINVTVAEEIPEREVKGLKDIKRKHKNLKKFILVNPKKEYKEEFLEFVKIEYFLMRH